MKKVITYGTFDLLHYGHIRLLERAKALGDYLIVGVTSDDYDKARGKSNVKQTLMERIEGVRKLNLADEIIVEEYAGQKIDDVWRYGVNIFVIGDDWLGKFDYLKEYCDVVYLPRTEGISSTNIRSKDKINIGLVGDSITLEKFYNECQFVNGALIDAICTSCLEQLPEVFNGFRIKTNDYSKLLDNVDAVYLLSNPKRHYREIKEALRQGKHVLCEAPISLSQKDTKELFKFAKSRGLVLLEGNKTAYSTAYNRLILLLKTGVIGEIVSIDVTCTSQTEKYFNNAIPIYEKWNSIEGWGSKALLPVFQIMGVEYVEKRIISHLLDDDNNFDDYTRMVLVYSDKTANILVGRGIKAEGAMIISGTKGYIYVPAPWWKMDYFESRFEDSAANKKYFYQLEGEGIRYEIITFVGAIESGKRHAGIGEDVSVAVSGIMEDFYNRKDFIYI